MTWSKRFYEDLFRSCDKMGESQKLELAGWGWGRGRVRVEKETPVSGKKRNTKHVDGRFTRALDSVIIILSSRACRAEWAVHGFLYKRLLS